MLTTVRSGHAIVRNLQHCIPRLRSTSVFRASIAPLQPLIRASCLPVRTFYASSLRSSAASASAAQARQEPGVLDTAEQITEFSELGQKQLVHENVVNAITQGMKLSTMTDVQSKTIAATLQGEDVLGQAKTGTGKTLAFLIPVVQRILNNDPSLTSRKLSGRSASDIRAIIISPTRELAEQIAVEARRVVSQTGIMVQTAVGGTRKREGLQRIRHQGCHLLVGTPGRLIDIFSDPESGVAAPNLTSLVLDEADRLLDQGFAPDIEELQEFLPRRSQVDRQTLLFSATLPSDVMAVVRKTMKPVFSFVKTVDDNEAPTHLAVPQKAVTLRGLENQMPALLELAQRYVKSHQADPSKHRPFKAIVFYNSTAEVSLAQQAYSAMRLDPANPRDRRHPLPELRAVEMHSKLTQDQRTRNSAAFRGASSAILFSSDVSARGMDFPDVTHVIQMGMPQTADSYVHRIGRTARANKTGEGWLFITEAELFEVRSKLRKIPIQSDKSLQTAAADVSNPAAQAEPISLMLTQTTDAFRNVEAISKFSVYRALLGTMRHVSNKRELVQLLNQLSLNAWGMTVPPRISSTTAAKLGFTTSHGINISEGFMGDRGDRYGGDRDARQPGEYPQRRRQSPFGKSTKSGFSRDFTPREPRFPSSFTSDSGFARDSAPRERGSSEPFTRRFEGLSSQTRGGRTGDFKRNRFPSNDRNDRNDRNRRQGNARRSSPSPFY